MRDLKSLTGLTKVSAALAVAGVLAGCSADQPNETPVDAVLRTTFDHANWQQRPPTVRNAVEPITVVHSVGFGSGQTGLSDQERNALFGFLEDNGIHEGARIEIDGPRIDGYHDPATAARLRAIQSELRRVGIESQIAVRPITSLARPENDVVVTLTRAMVIPPDCSAPQPEFATRPDYTYGCATAAMHGRMVADPVDLVRGSNPGPADGEASTLSIQRYRKGETKPLNGEGISN